MERNNSKNYNLLIAIEQIVEKAKDSQLSKDYLRKVAKPLNYMAAELELTKEQSLMLALFINKSDSNSIELSDLSKYLNCSTARLLLYSNDIEALEEREFIRCCRGSHNHKGISYRVPYVYCHYKDKAKADEYVTKRNELNSYHTSTTTTAESKLHKRYAALYNQICNGNTDYELSELEEIYKYLQSENEKNTLEKKKHSNTLYAESLRIRDLSILEDLIKNKQQEQDYDMPF